MPDSQFRGFAQESLSEMTPARQNALVAKADATRLYAATLPPQGGFSAEIRPLEARYRDRITKDKVFATAFGQVPHRFAWVRPENLVAIQACVTTEGEDVPTTESGLVEFALPRKWYLPAEVTCGAPGTFYMVGNSPLLTGSVNLEMDNKHGRVILRPPIHINLVQLMHFASRYYVRNGTHRVAAVLAAGRMELPALVVDANHPGEVDVPQLGFAGFNSAYSMSLPRPPLISDFGGVGSMNMRMRERRYGSTVTMQVSPISVAV